MARIDLAIYTEDPDEAAALQAYWRLADDGESWAQTVAAVRTEHGLKPQEMTAIVQGCGTAHLPEITCPQCGEAQWATSRSNFAEVIRQGNVLCASCRAASQAEREKAARVEAARRRAEIQERFPVRFDADLTPEDLSLFQAVAVHALFSDPAVEDAGVTTPTSGWPKERRWAPARLLYDFERRLIRADMQTIKPHLSSHPDVFVFEDGAPTGSFYLSDVSYYLLGEAEELSARHPRLLQALNRVFRVGPWPEAWLNQWRDLWDELALADAQVYLDMKLGEHRLEMKQGDGTRTALEDALASFSLGQVFNFIYRAAKDSAAYYQRGGVNKQQAANSTIGRISAAADRARANGWDVKSFGRPWNLPLSAIGELFFSKVMWQGDMMHAAARDAHPPSHSWPHSTAAADSAASDLDQPEVAAPEEAERAAPAAAPADTEAAAAPQEDDAPPSQEAEDAEGSHEAAEQREGLLNRLGIGRKRDEGIPTPWPGLSELITLDYNAKVGIVAEPKTREARVGRDIAVHAAKAGVPTVLFTRFPPENLPPLLLIDENPYPTAEAITSRSRSLIRGESPRFLVVERFERMHTEPEPQPNEYEDYYEEREEVSWADRLMYAVRDVRLDYPSLWTTVLPGINPARPLRDSAKNIDHPAMILTDLCKQLLVVRRQSPEVVDVRVELDGLGPRSGRNIPVQWQPLNLHGE